MDHLGALWVPPASTAESIIPKSVQRFLEKIMLKQETGAG
jgi:hypothetical protein